MQNGAFGWLEKPCNDDRLIEMIDQALARARSLASRLRAANGAMGLWQRLTAREKQVAPLVAEGLPNKVIARDLVPPCGHRAVETHRAHIFAKLEVANSHELYRFMHDNGIADTAGTRPAADRPAAGD